MRRCLALILPMALLAAACGEATGPETGPDDTLVEAEAFFGSSDAEVTQARARRALAHAVRVTRVARRAASVLPERDPLAQEIRRATRHLGAGREAYREGDLDAVMGHARAAFRISRTIVHAVRERG